MKLSVYQVDAFADEVFTGNPAAVVPLQQWLRDETMQAIAAENNLSETAFFVPTAKGFRIRWFTPKAEVKLCGHATLASAFVVFECLDFSSDTVVFESPSGLLSVSKAADRLTLDFPRQVPQPCSVPPSLSEALASEPLECLSTEDLIAVFETEHQVATLQPNLALLQQLDCRGIIVTAPAAQTATAGCDFVARFFAPRVGIAEDPVTGSAYTQLMPYWSEKFGRQQLRARQLSARGGRIDCELRGERVLISGRAVKYLEGTIEI